MRFSVILNPPALPRLSHALSTTHRESGEESGLAAVAPKGNSNNTATGHTRAPAWFWKECCEVEMLLFAITDCRLRESPIAPGVEPLFNDPC